MTQPARRKMPATPELDIQRGFINRLRYVAPAVSVVAIPNAAKRTQWAAMQAKKEGLKAGFPDCQCLAPGGLIAFIEFKAAGGRVSENQAEWLERLTRWGFPCIVARSVEQAVEFLRCAGFPVMGNSGRDAASTAPGPQHKPVEVANV